MFHDTRFDPLNRFNGLAATYANYRPNYPSLALAHITQRQSWPLVIADIGCGTGILSRALAESGCTVIGIDPNNSMLDEARKIVHPHVDYRLGQAEKTGLDSESVNAVVVAQAFHWFQPHLALAEFYRILRNNSWVTLLWNEVDLTDPFSAEYWTVMQRFSTAPEVVHTPHSQTGLALLQCEQFTQGCHFSIKNEQILSENGLIGRAFSASYAPREPAQTCAMSDSLSALYQKYSLDDHVVLSYKVEIFQAHKD